MPIYEYRCGDCGCRFSKLVLRPSGASSLSCPRCNSGNISRLFSSFRMVRAGSEEEALEDVFSDSKLLEGLERNDPRALAECGRRMARVAGEDLGPEYEEMLNRLEAGEPPEEVMGEEEEDADL